MAEVRVSEELWATSMAPEGVVERWFAADGAQVSAGDPLVEVQIEDACHEILAPAAGRLSILSGKNCLIEPGTLLGLITR